MYPTGVVDLLDSIRPCRHHGEHKIGCGLNTEPAGTPDCQMLLVYHSRAEGQQQCMHRMHTYTHTPVMPNTTHPLIRP